MRRWNNDWAKQRLEVWRTDGKQPTKILDVLNGVVDCAFTPTNEILVLESRPREPGGTPDGTLVLGRCTISKPPRPADVTPLPNGAGRIALNPQRAELAVSVGNRVDIVDVTTGKLTKRSLPANVHFGIGWHPHGELLAINFAHHVELWNVRRIAWSRVWNTPGEEWRRASTGAVTSR